MQKIIYAYTATTQNKYSYELTDLTKTADVSRTLSGIGLWLNSKIYEFQVFRDQNVKEYAN